MRALAGLAASGTFLPLVTEASGEPTTLAALAPKSPLSPEDDQFLEEIEHLNFCYFWEQVDPDTGMVKDRSNIRTVDNGIVASIAATRLTYLETDMRRRLARHHEHVDSAFWGWNGPCCS